MYLFSKSSILEVDFVNLCIYVETQKYTRSTFSKLMYFFSVLEIYLNIDVFILKLKSILEVDFQNLCIYLQTLKYT